MSCGAFLHLAEPEGETRQRFPLAQRFSKQEESPHLKWWFNVRGGVGCGDRDQDLSDFPSSQLHILCVLSGQLSSPSVARRTVMHGI